MHNFIETGEEGKLRLQYCVSEDLSKRSTFWEIIGDNIVPVEPRIDLYEGICTNLKKNTYTVLSHVPFVVRENGNYLSLYLVTLQHVGQKMEYLREIFAILPTAGEYIYIPPQSNVLSVSGWKFPFIKEYLKQSLIDPLLLASYVGVLNDLVRNVDIKMIKGQVIESTPLVGSEYRRCILDQSINRGEECPICKDSHNLGLPICTDLFLIKIKDDENDVEAYMYSPIELGGYIGHSIIFGHGDIPQYSP
jgi:hypothetical protein